MRRLINTLSLAGSCCTAALALGATVRLQAKPVTTDNGTTLTVHGALTGLSPSDFVVKVRATGTASVQCVDPTGNEPPGPLRRVPVVLAADETIQGSWVNNGNATFEVVTLEPNMNTVSCPRSGWTADLRDVTFRSITIRVLQGGRVVLRRSYGA